MTISRYKTIGLLAATVLVGGVSMNGCTNLDDKVFGSLSSTDATTGSIQLDPAATLQGAYQALNPIANSQGRAYALEEHSSDEMMGPTRVLTGTILAYGANCTSTPGIRSTSKCSMRGMT